jgi:hypothetical protein
MHNITLEWYNARHISGAEVATTVLLSLETLSVFCHVAWLIIVQSSEY